MPVGVAVGACLGAWSWERSGDVPVGVSMGVPVVPALRAPVEVALDNIQTNRGGNMLIKPHLKSQ